MNLEEQILNSLKKQQERYAVEALRRPSDKTEFEYGFRSGYFHGLEDAVNILLEEVKKDHDNDI